MEKPKAVTCPNCNNAPQAWGTCCKLCRGEGCVSQTLRSAWLTMQGKEDDEPSATINLSGVATSLDKQIKDRDQTAHSGDQW